VAMIEHVRAVDNLDKILQVEGLDAILIGLTTCPPPWVRPHNLKSLGSWRQWTESVPIVASVASPVGVHVVMPDPAALEQRVAEGYRFIAYSIDAVFSNQIRRLSTFIERLPMENIGQSKSRNKEFREKFSRERLLQHVVKADAPVIFDVGAQSRGKRGVFEKNSSRKLRSILLNQIRTLLTRFLLPP